GTIRQLGHLAAAVVHVGHAVAIDTLLVFVVVARLATLHAVGLRRGHRPITTHALLVTDGRADHGATRSGRLAALAVADLVADDGADGCAEQRAAGDLRAVS